MHHITDSRLIGRQELLRLVPLSWSSIGRLEKKGDFPRRIKIGARKVAWSLREVLEWLANKLNQRYLTRRS